VGVPEIWALIVETYGGTRQFLEAIEEMGMSMIIRKTTVTEWHL
jgi:hypothetical protein